MRYVLNRLARFLLVFFIVTFSVTVLMRLGLHGPGEPARTMLGSTASEQQIAEVTRRYHLHSNIFAQYWYWLKGLFSGDLGSSVQNVTVAQYIKPRVWTTVFLGVYATVLALVIAIPLAVYQAYRRDTWRDRLGNLWSFVFVSVPPLVLAPLLIYVFVGRLHWFPRISERVMPWDSFGGHVRNFLLPVIILALPLAAVFTRLLRSDMVQTLQSDFITMASAKGMSPARVLWGHALRNSLLSLLTSVGIQLGTIVGGALVVERYFDLDGLGLLLVTTILTRDLFVVQAIVAILVATVVIINLIIDLLYAVVDPRIRQMRSLG